MVDAYFVNKAKVKLIQTEAYTDAVCPHICLKVVGGSSTF